MSSPKSQPQASLDTVRFVALSRWRKEGHEEPLPKVYVLAVRGYWKASVGDPTRNDVGVWDDAFFLVTPTKMLAERANTDPSKIGWNPGVGKPYFMLDEGVWFFYPGAHKGVKPAFRQADNAAVAKALGIPNGGKFTGVRMWGWNDPRNYKETGHQQVNIHPGGDVGTSSWACQTLPRARATAWLQAATDELKAHGQKLLPYILIEGPIN